MKKERWIIILTSLLLIQPILAQNQATSNVVNFLNQTMNAVVLILTASLGPIFGALIGVDNYDQFFFAKVLVFILLYIMVSTGLKRSGMLGNNRAAVLIISIIVSILSVRFMGDSQFLLGLLLPYGAMGATITIFLPLLIFSLFVHTSVPGTIFRRSAWILYSIIFGTMWYLRQGDIGSANTVYMWGLIFVVIFVIFDPAVHRYFNAWGLERITAGLRAKEERIVRREIADLHEDRRRGIIDEAHFNNELRILQDRLRSFS